MRRRTFSKWIHAQQHVFHCWPLTGRLPRSAAYQVAKFSVQRRMDTSALGKQTSGRLLKRGGGPHRLSNVLNGSLPCTHARQCEPRSEKNKSNEREPEVSKARSAWLTTPSECTGLSGNMAHSQARCKKGRGSWGEGWAACQYPARILLGCTGGSGFTEPLGEMERRQPEDDEAQFHLAKQITQLGRRHRKEQSTNTSSL